MRSLFTTEPCFDVKGVVWFKPNTVSGTLDLMKKHPQYYLRQGGTGTYKKFKKQEFDTIIDISGVRELKQMSVTPDEAILNVGAGVTFTQLLQFLEAKKSINKDNTITELMRVVNQLATPQVRNVASLGGSILWDHPASDITPLLLAVDATLEISDVNGVTTKVTLEEVVRRKLQKKELLIRVLIPLGSEKFKIKFFKHARRTTADLAIANMSVAYNDVNHDVITNVKIYVGGIGLSVKDCPQRDVTRAGNLEKFLTGVNLNQVSLDDLCIAIEKDIPSATSNLEKTAFRISLICGFIKKLIADKVGDKDDSDIKRKSPIKFHQLYEKTPEEQELLDPITRPVPHISSAEQCSGEAVYVDDLPKFDRELTLTPVQSKVAHGRIKKINTTAAMNIDGVVAWISATDIPGRNLWTLGAIPDEEVFPSDTVQYVGQIIGLIAAENQEAGKEAANLVKVEYEKLPPLITLSDAIDNNSTFGDGASAKRDNRDQNKLPQVSSNMKISGTVNLGGQEHYYFEPHTALAVPTREKNELTIYYGHQSISNVQGQMAAVLNIPQHRIIVKCRRTGGGFGGKERMFTALMAGVAGHVTGRPCRLVLTRAVDVDTTGHRHECRTRYEVEFAEDGRILSSKFNIDINAGMSSDHSPPWADVLIKRIDGGYTLSKMEASAAVLKTNMVSNTAFRGFGSPEGALIIEDVIENISKELSVDPAVVREKNLTRQGDYPHHGEKAVNEDFLIQCWNECLEQSNYWETRKQVEEFNANHKYKKRGVSIVPMKMAPSIPIKFLNQASAFIRIYLDGSILLSHGGIEMGQGLHTKMVQVAAKMLRVDMSKIMIIDSSTEVIANATATGGSTGTDLNGFAVINACNKINESLDPLREAFPDDTWEETIQKAYFSRSQLSAFGFYNTSTLDYDDVNDTGSIFNYYTYGVGCSVVEVDCLTGGHQVLRTDIVMDVGRSLNPGIDIGQIEGAFVQGYGYMTMEELVHNNQGEILNKNLSTYKIPSVGDIPREFNVTMLRNAGNKFESVFSSKGIGEPPITLAVSVVCAIRQAIHCYRGDHGTRGAWTLDIPLTSERIRLACQDNITKFVMDKVQKGREDIFNIIQ